MYLLFLVIFGGYLNSRSSFSSVTFFYLIHKIFSCCFISLDGYNWFCVCLADFIQCLCHLFNLMLNHIFIPDFSCSWSFRLFNTFLAVLLFSYHFLRSLHAGMAFWLVLCVPVTANSSVFFPLRFSAQGTLTATCLNILRSRVFWIPLFLSHA